MSPLVGIALIVPFRRSPGPRRLALDGVRRLRLKAVPLAALPVGAWLIHTDHIVAPVGVVGMVLVGLGTAWAVHGAESSTRAVATVFASSAS